MSLSKALTAAAGNAAEDVAWNLAYAYYDPPAGLAFNITTSNYVFSLNFPFASQNTVPEGLFVSPDGTKMYMAGSAGNDSIYQYSLSTYRQITTASFVQSFVVHDGTPFSLTDVFFKSDGTKMYVLSSWKSAVLQYTLSTAWDISTAGTSSQMPSYVNGAVRQTEGMYIKPDGTKLYVCGQSGGGGTDRQVDQYDLSTAWDVTTATNWQRVIIPTLTNPQEIILMSVSFSSDGTRMFILGQTGDVIIEFPLSTAWDITTTGFQTARFSVSSQQTLPTGLFIFPNGSGFVICGETNDDADQYAMGGFIVSDQDTTPTGLFFKPDGTQMYIVGDQGRDVTEYSLSTAWDTATATFTQRSGTLAETDPFGISFKPDGTRMYIVGAGTDRVYEYSLSTPWNITTLTLVRNFLVSGQETYPADLYFKPDDGTKMYIVGSTADAVHEYSLSTGWDISTASFVQSFSVSSQGSNPDALYFKPDDGTKMYIVDLGTDAVNEYNLSTGWDISTASFVQSFSIAITVYGPRGLFMKDDGEVFYVVGSGGDKVFTYSIGEQ
jgi:sugar lactone lactonase YvrE